MGGDGSEVEAGGDGSGNGGSEGQVVAGGWCCAIGPKVETGVELFVGVGWEVEGVGKGDGGKQAGVGDVQLGKTFK